MNWQTADHECQPLCKLHDNRETEREISQRVGQSESIDTSNHGYLMPT